MNKEQVIKELENLWTNTFHVSSHKKDYTDELPHAIQKIIHDIKTGVFNND